jgi:hypothetical protein
VSRTPTRARRPIRSRRGPLRGLGRFVASTAGLSALSALPLSAAEGDLVELLVTPDVAVALPDIVAPVLDRDVLRTRPGTTLHSFLSLPPLPPGVGLASIDLAPSGDLFFAIEGFADLGLGGLVTPGAVVRIPGSGGPASVVALVPAGLGIDALEVVDPAAPEILFSIDVAARLPGNVDVQDEDVIRYTPKDGFSVALDLTNAVADGLDLDGLDRSADGGPWFLSFDGSGEVGGVPFDDEDVLAFEDATWSLAIDGSAAAPAWESADLAALAVLPAGLFSDTFETGELDRWSSRSPAP